jgi:hypothetical protein
MINVEQVVDGESSRRNVLFVLSNELENSKQKLMRVVKTGLTDSLVLILSMRIRATKFCLS